MSTFLGTGLKFPLEFKKGLPQLTSSHDLVKQSIRLILTWTFGQRPMIADFGSRLNQLIEEPHDFIARRMVEYFTVEALRKWEQRIRVTGSNVILVNDTRIDIEIHYITLSDRATDSLIFPFYRQI